MSVPRFWRFNRERYMMTGCQCSHCGERFFSLRLVCPACHTEIERVVRDVFPMLNTPLVSKQRSLVVSVLITSHNASCTIRDTLSSLLCQDFDEPYEIIVVDSSSDGTARIVATEFPSVHLIHREQEADPGAARNQGIMQAKGEIIACIDADCIAPRDWLTQMVAAQRAGHKGVGGAIENGNPGSILAWAWVLSEFRDFLPVGHAHLVAHIPACNISYHRSVFDRLGGFPTGFYPQEDLLYHSRLAQRGVSIWLDPAICIRHTRCLTWRSYIEHLRRAGCVTARVLKLTGGEGVFLARSPVLALLAAPALPLVKWLRTIGVFISQQPEVLRDHALALVPFLLGLYAWVWGFVEGAWSPPLRVAKETVVEGRQT